MHSPDTFPCQIGEGDLMTDEDVPELKINTDEIPAYITDIQNTLKEQQEAISNLTARINASEKVAAASAPAPTAAPKESPQDAAYKAMLKEMGIREE